MNYKISVSRGDISNSCLDEVCQVGWGYLELQAADSGTYVYGFKIHCGAVDIGWEAFLHSYR